MELCVKQHRTIRKLLLKSCERTINVEDLYVPFTNRPTTITGNLGCYKSNKKDDGVLFRLAIE